MSQPSPSPREFRVPDAVGEVYVARAWRLDEGDHTLLRSVNTPTTWWPDTAMTARCEPLGRHLNRLQAKPLEEGEHASPAPGCSCGIYGTFDPIGLAAELGFAALGTVFGLAAVWGRLVVHAKGIRAEFARPVALYHAPPPILEGWMNFVEQIQPPQIQRVADRYGIDLIDRWSRLTDPETL